MLKYLSLIPGATRTQVHVTVIPLLVRLLALYSTFLAGWFILNRVAGDRWWWLFLLNSGAAYLFLPLPLALIIALVSRQHAAWYYAGGACLLWAVLYAPLFLPRLPHSQPAASLPTLTVMTHNMLRHNEHPEGIVAAIRAAPADVVVLQELNPPAAAAIQRDLAERYPHQVLNPSTEVGGMGVISRYPLRATGETLTGGWMGGPQVVLLDFGGQEITLMNVHARSTTMGRGGNFVFVPDRMEWSIREREAQAQMIADFAATHPGPLIVAGDMNTSKQSHAYRIITRQMQDAWWKAGRGFGHTFPGATSPGSSRPRVAGVPVPRWLVRIDYVFCSPEWYVQSARIGPWDGVSDHRPVMATLHLTHPAAQAAPAPPQHASHDGEEAPQGFK